MGKDLIISSNRHETKVAILEDEQLVEIYFQRANEYSLVGSIHKGRVTRVLPGMQSAFVDIGLDRDAFLYVSDFFEDSDEYEPITDSEKTGRRPAQAAAAVSREEPESRDRRGRRSRRRRNSKSRGLPESKFASNVEEAVPEKVAGEVPPEPPAREPKPSRATEESDEFTLLPGESLAKYAGPDDAKERVVGAGDEPSDQNTGGDAPEETECKEKDDTQDPDNRDGDESEDTAEDEVWAGDGEPKEDEEHTQESSEDDEPDSEKLVEAVPEAEADGEVKAEAGEEVEAGGEPEEDESGDEDARVDDGGEEESSAEIESEDSDIQAMILGQLEEQSASEPEKRSHDGRGRRKRRGGRAETKEEKDEKQPRQGSAKVTEQDQRYLQRGSRRGRRRSKSSRTTDTTERRENVQDTPQKSPQQGGSRQEKTPAPLISDLLKEGQEILVQIAKEPLGQKGARITSHIAMPGRYVVYMPTLDHLGVSRKIGSDDERLRLRQILQSNREGMTGGFIMRTAGEGKTEQEIAADMNFLFNLWMDIRQTAEKKPAPVLLHHDLRVVERVLRDQVTEDFNTIWVDNEVGYENILRFLQRFQPALVKRVRMYTRPEPIFDAFNVTHELEKALRPKVWLKSGGYIVINQTEALVAIDINTGKFVGKSNRLEDTIVKTNVEAVKEIARQLRLRDLGGIIVLDFIDMDERKNRQRTMQALEEAMRSDRAPFKILQFNDFGLVAITRKRVKQSLERTLCAPCPYCEGAGYVRSVDTVIGEILTEAHKMAAALEGEDVILRVHPDVAKVLKSSENEYMQELEETLGGTVMITADPLLHHEKFDLA